MKGMNLRRKNYSCYDKIFASATYKKRKYPEDLLQIVFTNWLSDRGILFNASCTGMRATPKAMAKMRKMGAKKGFPDIQILEPKALCHGLFIELKSKTGTASKEQKEWQNELAKRAYRAVIMPRGLNHEEGLAWLKQEVNGYMRGGIKRILSI